MSSYYNIPVIIPAYEPDEKLLKLLRQLTGTVGQLAAVEKQKADAASRGDVAGVDECMKKCSSCSGS